MSLTRLALLPFILLAEFVLFLIFVGCAVHAVWLWLTKGKT